MGTTSEGIKNYQTPEAKEITILPNKRLLSTSNPGEEMHNGGFLDE